MNARKGWIATGAACVALTAGALFANEAGSAKSDQPITDSVITTKVKAELAKDRDTKARAIHVKTKDGVVTLTGSVDSMAEKDKAGQDAQEIKGVVGVTNNLDVKQK